MKAGADPVAAVAREVIRCPLCGNHFGAGEGPACQYCRRLFRSCGMVSCPRCGHEFPRAGAERAPAPSIL